MISLNQLGKSHGARTLFADASIQLNPGNRYGVVGANGSGKSTVLRIIAGQEEASTGSVSVPKNARVGVLEQDHFQYEDERIIDVVMMGNAELWQAMVEKEKLLANAHEHFDADRYTELEDIVIGQDGYSLEARAGEILEGLMIPTELHKEPLSTLSGGFKLRVLLAQTLAYEPEILLLDEPTNHLDIVSIAWLENFLKNYDGCVLVVSHDRRFLDAISTHILDVDYEKITLYTGDYGQFEVAKREERERMEARIAKQEQEIASHKAFVDRFRAKATKARQAQSKLKQMEKIVIEEIPQSSRQYPHFRFTACRPPGKEVVSAKGIHKSFDDDLVLNGVDITVHRDDRLAIIGPNGVGKSTFLKILMGQLEPDTGTVEWGYETHPGYFSQDHAELEETPEYSLLDWLWTYCPERNEGFVRGKLAEVLFTRDDVFKKLKNLSGGEAARLVFSHLNILEPNILVLDEPTNHLDLEGIEALVEGLQNYDGTIIFVSHDRWFVSQLATRVLELKHRGFDDYPGTYEQYLAHRGTDHLEH